jgi:hypothetical protein
MLLNKKYGIIGLLSFPYWVLFEWLGPIIQILGLIYFSVLLFLGLVNTTVFLFLLGLVLAFSVMYSIFSVFFEAFTYDKYKGKKYLGHTARAMPSEMPWQGSAASIARAWIYPFSSRLCRPRLIWPRPNAMA